MCPLPFQGLLSRATLIVDFLKITVVQEIRRLIDYMSLGLEIRVIATSSALDKERLLSRLPKRPCYVQSGTPHHGSPSTHSLVQHYTPC
jgi:hypothetical protein